MPVTGTTWTRGMTRAVWLSIAGFAVCATAIWAWAALARAVVEALVPVPEILEGA